MYESYDQFTSYATWAAHSIDNSGSRLTPAERARQHALQHAVPLDEEVLQGGSDVQSYRQGNG